MPIERPTQQFHCASCGYHAAVRFQPRGCPLCHAPSPARAPWGGPLLTAQARSRRAARSLVRS